MDSVSSISTTATGSRNKSSKNTLLHKHMDYFVERGILLVWALANARSVTAREATELLGFIAKSDGIWFEGANSVGQFRPDTRWKNEKGKQVGKFLSPLRTVCEIDIFLPNHPTELDYWETANLKKACYQINDHPHLVATEGPAKAIAGCAKGIPTVAVSGVDNGLTGQKKDPEGKRFLVPTLRKLAEAGFGFIIAYDADMATNPSVAAAERTLATQLNKFKVPVRTVTGKWELIIEGKDTKGMDDFIHHRGIEEFRAILSKAKLFGEGDSGEPLDTGDKKKSKQPPIPQVITARLAEEFGHQLKYDEEQQTWRKWSGKHWEKIGLGAFRSWLKNTLDGKSVNYGGSAFLEDVRKLLECDLRQLRWQFWDKSRYINFNNCVFDGAEAKSEPHSPGMGFTSHLPYDYKPLEGDLGDSLEALRVNCPKVHKFLRVAMQGDERKMFKLLAIINALLKYRFFDLQMFVHLVGAPGSGKGKFMRFCQKLVGKGNTIACQLDKLGDGSKKASLMDKQLVVFPDERKPVGIDSILSLTGGDEISYRELYQPAASAHFYGSIMIASNKPIFIGDTTGLERRLCLVNFDNPIAVEERKHSLEAELDGEISACIAIALSLSDDAVTQAIQGIGASRIAEYKAKEWEMKVEVNSVAAFFDAELVLDPLATTRVGKIYDAYKYFCEEGGLSKFSIVKFPRLLADIFTDENLPVTRHQGAVAYFEGVRIREKTDTHLTHSQVLEGVEMGVVGSFKGVGEGVAPPPDKGLRELRELDTKLLTRSENEDDYLAACEESDLEEYLPPSTPSTPSKVEPVKDTTPSPTPSKPPKSSPQLSVSEAAREGKRRRVNRLADEMRGILSNLSHEKAWAIWNQIQYDPQSRGFFEQALTEEENRKARVLIFVKNFPEGASLKYVGKKYCEQFEGVELKLYDAKGDSEITCRKPDGSTVNLLIKDVRPL